MTQWPAVKAKRVLAALLRVGWNIKRQSGSHRTLVRDGWPDMVFAFQDQYWRRLCSDTDSSYQPVSVRDIAKARTNLGWSPTIDVTSGIQWLTEWVKANTILFE